MTPPAPETRPSPGRVGAALEERLGPVTQAIERSGWPELLADLVRTPSHPGVSRQEEAVVQVLARWLGDRGLEVELSEVAPGRPNLIARTGRPGTGRRLLLCGHTDTVPPNQGDARADLAAEVHDGRMHGRGTVDMKGGVAAMAAALAGLHASKTLEAGEVILAAVVDEEMESLGAEYLARSGLGADGGIVPEPTGNRVALGHRGLEWLELDFMGRASHGGAPEQGINAIAAAARFITLAQERLPSRFEARTHPLLGPPTLNFGTIRGGDQPSTVAAFCRVAADRRTVPGETFETVVAELRELLERVEAEIPGLRTEVRRMPGGMATMEHLPAIIPADHAVAKAARAACERVRGRPESDLAFPAWTDASLLFNFGGIPCVILGPGDLALAHTPRESIALEEVGEAARIYAATALEFCPR